eukprot:TRINITY_DN9278_c0_g1_i2.p1 TRINITY_DN9278_c0_g1~~TRINITY_DN9278_c0_g1_i2.p1  ORF type:complete len:178 (+),score=39.15 TRINITY_DN9278_c0_g1_i2:655-1188(+)
MGVQYSDAEVKAQTNFTQVATDMSQKRRRFQETAKELSAHVLALIPEVLDSACDQVAVALQHARLPPPLGPSLPGPIDLNSCLKLTSAQVARLVVEDEQAVLYHCAKNARAYHGLPIQGLVFDLDQAEAVDFVLGSYPGTVKVSEIPMETTDDKLDIANNLFEQGILYLVECKCHPH